ncbi:ImmA/IrrE family metallo-endopeptidase [Clostridium botulinum]|uniref:ImmA/IrrE family metallo-endopeptidase n=1 Tax=Clostridium botulinum TaxID=1491 RepID=UPI00249F8AA0|nr:ImmA/IrrE family metallo-endopeptidase [Clostridium botulinum]MDU4596501.1 ImmA/IrrE family metallo-endopeptidase [Clostridium sporogenes]
MILRSIKNIADKLIREYNTRDPYELAYNLNVVILEEELGHVNGFYQACPKTKIIHLNKNLEPIQKKIVCAHELGHALLHSKLNILFLEKNTFVVKNKYEKEANKFAAELIIPDDIIYRYKNFTIEQIASLEQVNIELLELKFK